MLLWVVYIYFPTFITPVFGFFWGWLIEFNARAGFISRFTLNVCII